MSVTTVWTHGNSLVVEDPGEYAYIRHRGWGTELGFAGPRDDEDILNLSLRYSHIPIPTPASVDGDAPWLTKIYVLYETKGFMRVGRIDVWDGNNPVCQFNETYDPENRGLGHGNHLTLDLANQLTLSPPYLVSAGIGVTFACDLTYLPPDEPEIRIKSS